MSDSSVLDEVIDKMNVMVSRDGGRIEVRSYDETAGRLEVDYTFEVNEDCPTCTITGDMLNAFLKESLRSHDVSIEQVIVFEPQGQH